MILQLFIKLKEKIIEAFYSKEEAENEDMGNLKRVMSPFDKDIYALECQIGNVANRIKEVNRKKRARRKRKSVDFSIDIPSSLVKEPVIFKGRRGMGVTKLMTLKRRREQEKQI